MESQLNDENSIRNMYKTMIRLRAQSDVLKAGDFKALEIKKDLFAYERNFNGQTLRIVLNFSKREQQTAYQGNVVLSNYGRKTFDGKLKPYEAVILGKEDSL